MVYNINIYKLFIFIFEVKVICAMVIINVKTLVYKEFLFMHFSFIFLVDQLLE